jgi:hypothetical protein
MGTIGETIPFTIGGGKAPPRMPTPAHPPAVTGNPFTYYSYDFLTGDLLGVLALRGVKFGQQLNTPGQLSGTIDLQDPRVQAMGPLVCTNPNRTFMVVDYGGSIIWAGPSMTRRWKVEASGASTTRTLEVGCSETWAWFQQRVQATDYSSPPYSGISGESTMPYWTKTPWDASLTACQVIGDAVGYTDGLTEPFADVLGGLGLLLNGSVPSGSQPAAPEADWVAVSYPFTSLQTVDTIVSQLGQLGLGVGFDHGVDVAYSDGVGSTPVATINISYPRRGRTFAENNLILDLTTARSYEIPEDGTQTANEVYGMGGSGAIEVAQNVVPLEQGYPLWERVISRANAQSQNILGLLAQAGLSDLALYSYSPVAPTVTIGVNDPNLPLGSFTIGDDIKLFAPQYAPNGELWDPRLPAGLEQEWRIVSYEVEVKDEGDATVKLSLALPPYLQALVPAV